ncbi:MAG: nucleoside triphosphate hydrolase [Tatlockia sp.]|nr:nucleoside triphosphate hydrolase [Tatlockia sp.]
MNLVEKIVALEKEAAEFGFEWETAGQIMDQIQSECMEVSEHLVTDNRNDLQEEIGDLMHAVFSLCVFCKLDPMETLQLTTQKFERRLREVIKITKENKLENVKGQSFEELMVIWKQAKKRVG